MSKVIDVNKLIDTAELSPYHYFLTAICFLFTMVNGYAVVTLSLIVPLLAEDWGLAVSQFAPAHMAVMVGILIGSIVAGMLSDKYGRRITILFMTLIATIFMAISTLATSLGELIVYRALTGFGAGAIPVVLALISEYIPKAYRNLLVVIVFAGPPFSGVIAGNLGPQLTDVYGWEAIFYLGLAITVPTLLLGLFLLPESIKYLIIKNKQTDKVHTLLKRLLPNYKAEEGAEFKTNQPLSAPKSSFAELFADNRTNITLLIWLLFFSTQFVMFFLNLWVPTVLVNEGWTLQDGGKALANFNLGSFFGGFLIGRAADKYGASNILKIIFPLSAFSLFALGFCLHNPLLYFVVAFFAGGATLGANMALGPFSASLYPVKMRGTGMGTAIGIGRLGAMSAALIGGILISKGVKGINYYHLAITFPIICLVGIFVLSNILEKRKAKQIATI